MNKPDNRNDATINAITGDLLAATQAGMASASPQAAAELELIAPKKKVAAKRLKTADEDQAVAAQADDLAADNDTVDSSPFASSGQAEEPLRFAQAGTGTRTDAGPDTPAVEPGAPALVAGGNTALIIGGGALLLAAAAAGGGGGGGGGGGTTTDNTAPTVAITDNVTATTATGPVTFTFTFSEAVTGFTIDDVVVSGGTKGTFTAVSSTVYTLVVTPTADTTGTITVNVAANTAQDGATNGNTAATQAVQAFDTTTVPGDTTPPTVAITDNVTGTADGPVTFTFTFDEDVSGFTADDITVSGGTKGAFTAVSSTVYTLVVTPTADTTGNITVDVAANVAMDAASNGNTAATQAVQAFDTTAPTVTSVLDNVPGTANLATTNVAYDYTFSEPVTGLAADDFTVTNGSISSITGSGTTWTVNVTPAAGVASGNIGLALRANAVTDATANPNAASSQNSQTIDTVAPAVVNGSGVSSATGAQGFLLSAGDTITVTGTVTEDVTVTGTPRLPLTIGTTPVQADYDPARSDPTHLAFTYTIQPTDNGSISFAANSFDLNGGTITDLAGNAAILAHDAGVSVYSADTTAPTITVLAPDNTADNTPTITGTTNAPDGTTVTVTVTDSATAVQILTTTATGGAFNVTPTALPVGAYTAAASVADAAGNVGTANDAGSVIAFTGPTVSSIAITDDDDTQHTALNDGDTVSVTVTMSEAVTVTGIPQLELNIGGALVLADYVSGSGTTALVFNYMIQPAQNDLDGISIDADSLTLNGGTIRNASAVDAALTHAAVAANVGYIVDNTPPAVAPNLSTMATVTDTAGANATVQGTEAGTIYLVRNDVAVSTLADITVEADNLWNQVAITDTSATSLSLDGLDNGTYWAYAADATGNLSLLHSANTITIADNTAHVLPATGSASFVENFPVQTGDTYWTLDARVYDPGLTEAGITYIIGGADSGFFQQTDATIDGNTGAVVFPSGIGVNQNINFESGHAATYSITVQAQDGAGNLSNVQNVTLTVTNAGDATHPEVINLGANGQLIMPVQAGGNWYYFWDQNGDGIIQGSDSDNHNFLDTTFIRDATNSATPNPNVATTGTDSTYRYADISGNWLAVPLASQIQTLAGLTDGWPDYGYWAAEPDGAGRHAYVELPAGALTSDVDGSGIFLVVEYLGTPPVV